MDRENSPTVSVIIPSYNRQNSLVRALESVASQTHPNIETIVIDDHSEEPIEEWLSNIDHNIDNLRVLRLRQNRGAPAARSTGIKHATGDYLAFLDDDDQWKSTKLRRQLEVLETTDNVGLVYVGREFVADGQVTDQQTPSRSGDLHKALLCENFIGTYSAVMVRSAVVDDAGLPDNRFPTEQDWEWYIRVSRDWDVVGIPEPLVTRHGSGISEKYTVKRDTSYPLLLEKYESDAAEYGWLFVRYWKSRIMFNIGWEALVRTDERTIARRYFLRSLAYNPFNYSAWVFLIGSVVKPFLDYIPNSLKQRLGQLFRP